MVVNDAAAVVRDLEQRQSDTELAKVRKRLHPDDAAIGVRMGDLQLEQLTVNQVSI